MLYDLRARQEKTGRRASKRRVASAATVEAKAGRRGFGMADHACLGGVCKVGGRPAHLKGSGNDAGERSTHPRILELEADARLGRRLTTTTLPSLLLFPAIEARMQVLSSRLPHLETQVECLSLFSSVVERQAASIARLSSEDKLLYGRSQDHLPDPSRRTICLEVQSVRCVESCWGRMMASQTALAPLPPPTHSLYSAFLLQTAFFPFRFNVYRTDSGLATFQDLPVELVQAIASRLTPAERRSLAFSCGRFCEILAQSVLPRETKLNGDRALGFLQLVVSSSKLARATTTKLTSRLSLASQAVSLQSPLPSSSNRPHPIGYPPLPSRPSLRLPSPPTGVSPH